MWVGCIRRDGKLGRVPLNLDGTVPADPLDPAQLRGLFVYLDAETVRAAVPGDPGPFYSSHFSTCSNADMFRAGR
jgi:hypothetical protein